MERVEHEHEDEREGRRGRGPPARTRIESFGHLGHENKDDLRLAMRVTERWQHRKLAAYERALQLVGILETVAVAIPASRSDLRDQLRRAVASIPLNLAEGAAEYRSSEKARFYRMARRSAAECAAILDVLQEARVQHERPAHASQLLDEIAAMLTALILAVEAQRR